ncbi:MAG: xanthine dehydrogenase family protein subunit M [Pseudomonadota bacterium]
MYDFAYHRPASVAEARQLLADNEDAKLIAGGMTLFPTMKMRLANPSDLIDLGGIESLHGIRDAGDSVEIGAMTTHADIAASEVVRAGVPGLAELAGLIGDAQVRNRGTLGGSLSNCDPAADYPAAVLALNAVIRTDRREISADSYFLGMFETPLEQDEILESVRFPKVQRAAYAKFPNPASRYAVVGVMLAETPRGIRVAVTGAAACVFRATAIEAALSKDFSEQALEGLTIGSAELNEDSFANAEYRAHLVIVMARRAVAAISSGQQPPG